MNEFHPGDPLGDYRLEQRLDEGGQGYVWRARAATGGRLVAIKLLTKPDSQGETGRLRQNIEVLAATAANRSPHIVHVLGGGTEPVPHIVMEYVDGTDLRKEMARLRDLHGPGGGLMAEADVVAVGIAVSDALAVLHDEGIIHRDVKPANIMLDHRGGIKLADFGIAKIVGANSVTVTNSLPMTLFYAAPEVWAGEAVPASDIYALGITLFELLAGTPPFQGAAAALLRAHMSGEPDFSTLPSSTDPALVALISTCLRKEPAQRPPAAECLATLSRIAAGEGDQTVATAARSEPVAFGPWRRLDAFEGEPWSWLCENRAGARAIVDVAFAVDLRELEQGMNRARKAIEVNPALIPYGAERLLGADRLLLGPNEAWRQPAPARFSFWVARETPVPASVATSVTAEQLRRLTSFLASSIDIAESQSLALDFSAQKLSGLSGGNLRLLRPGLAANPPPMRPAALAFLRGLPLDAQGRAVVERAPSFDSLAATLSNAGQATVVGPRPEQAKVVGPAVLRPDPVVAGAPPSVRPAPAPDLRPTAVRRRPRASLLNPYLLSGAGALGIIVIAAFVLLSSGGHGGGSSPAESAAAGQAKLDSYDYLAALDAFNGALKANSSNAAALAGRATAYLNLGDIDTAGADAEKAVSVEPGNAAGYAARALVRDWQQRHDESIADITKAIDLGPDKADYYAYRSEIYGDYDHARQMADANKAVQIDAKNAEGHAALAFALRGLHKYTEAMAEQQKAATLAPRNGLYAGGLGWNFYYAEDYVSALQKLDENAPAISSYPLSSAEGHAARGAALTGQNQATNAVAEFSKAIELVPSAPNYYDWRGFAYSLANDYDHALADFNKAIQMAPQFAEPYRDRASVLSQQNRLDDALADLGKAIGLNPNVPAYFSDRAFAYSQRQDYSHALADVNQAIKLDPLYADAYNVRALIAQDQGRPADALPDIGKAIQISPKQALYYANRGSISYDLDRYQDTLNDLNKAIDLDPSRATSYNIRGNAYYSLNNYQAAISDYSSAISKDESNPQFFLNRGDAYKQLGRKAEARTDFQKGKSIAMTPEKQKEAQAALDALGP